MGRGSRCPGLRLNQPARPAQLIVLSSGRRMLIGLNTNHGLNFTELGYKRQMFMSIKSQVVNSKCLGNQDLKVQFESVI